MDFLKTLERRILGGALSPGFVLPPLRVIAQEEHVSRGEVERAIKSALSLGLLENGPRRSVKVADWRLYGSMDLVRRMLACGVWDEALFMDIAKTAEGIALSAIVGAAQAEALRAALSKRAEDLAEARRRGESDYVKAIIELLQAAVTQFASGADRMLFNTLRDPLTELFPFVYGIPTAEDEARLRAACAEGDGPAIAQALADCLARGKKRGFNQEKNPAE